MTLSSSLKLYKIRNETQKSKMDPKVRTWLDVVVRCLREIQNDFEVNRALLLTEGDLECELYRRLLDVEELAHYGATKRDGWRTRFVHSQVTWFSTKPDRTAKHSGFEVDLTIFDPANIDVQTFAMDEYYPNKGYVHDGECIAIELKFIRTNARQEVANRANYNFIKTVDRLRVEKNRLVESGHYQVANMNNVGFVVVVGCKTDAIFDMALEFLQNAIENRPCPENVFPIMFSPTRVRELNPHA